MTSLHSSANRYNYHDISTNVCTKACTHSSFGCDTHMVWHVIRWLLGSFHPSYLSAWYCSTFPKQTVFNLRHYDHPLIDFLWVAHQLAGVSFNASSNDSNHCGSDTVSSNSVRNSTTQEVLHILETQQSLLRLGTTTEWLNHTSKWITQLFYSSNSPRNHQNSNM